MRRPLLVLSLFVFLTPGRVVAGDLFERLPPPRKGEWRAEFHEREESFGAYRAKHPEGPTAARTRFYLLPLFTRPPEDRRILEELRVYLEADLGHPVAALKPRALPRNAFSIARRQLSVERLLPTLRAALPHDGFGLLAVTDRDLFAGELTHTFGWASMTERVGIVSTARLRAEGRPDLRLRRLLGLAGHENGHLLSLTHCVTYRCEMNGVISLAEADARPLLLCPLCRKKLCWDLGLDPVSRYEALRKAWTALGLAREASRAAAAAKSLEKSGISRKMSPFTGPTQGPPAGSGAALMDELNYRRLVARPKRRCEDCGATSYEDPEGVYRCVVCDHERFEICLDCGQLRGWCECPPVEVPVKPAAKSRRVRKAASKKTASTKTAPPKKAAAKAKAEPKTKARAKTKAGKK